MGLYNEYGRLGIQLKVGDLKCKTFGLIEHVDIPDGVYLGYEGVVVISGGRFVAEFQKDAIYDKYGNIVDIKEIIDKNNPLCQLVQLVKEFEKGGKKHGRRLRVETRGKKRK